MMVEMKSNLVGNVGPTRQALFSGEVSQAPSHRRDEEPQQSDW